MYKIEFVGFIAKWETTSPEDRYKPNHHSTLNATLDINSLVKDLLKTEGYSKRIVAVFNIKNYKENNSEVHSHSVEVFNDIFSC